MKDNKKTKTSASAMMDKRKESYLTEEVAQMLIAQVGHELNNEYLYHNFAIWYDMNTLLGQAEYFYRRKNEEKEQFYQPAMDIGQITVSHVLSKVEKHGVRQVFLEKNQEDNLQYDLQYFVVLGSVGRLVVPLV